jgi:hypothetical protein
MSAVGLHTRALRAIEQRLDALLQGRSGYSISISGDCGRQRFCVEATAGLTNVCVSFNSSGVYYDCASDQSAIQAFFNRVSENEKFNKTRDWKTVEHQFLFYTLKETANTIKLVISGQGRETLEFEKEEGTWIDQNNR